MSAYAEAPRDVLEHASIELATTQGGYGRRQLYELVQNGADALLDGPGGRIECRLTDECLYVANEGAPIDRDGIDTILASHVSRKRGTEIGRFGLGFKSVLEVTSTPQFFSRTISVGFDAEWAARTIGEVVPDAPAYPTLRVGQLISAHEASQKDPILAELMDWAASIVRLPRDRAAARWLNEDLRNFPAEFLVFAPHVTELKMVDETEGLQRRLTARRDDDVITISDGGNVVPWLVFRTHHVPTSIAREDAGQKTARDMVPVIWAVPREGRRERGEFWAFFPTTYRTTLTGILNAPWKTNEDRQNLLEGPFNRELLEVAARLVVENAPALRDWNDPARHLDFIPARGRESANWADDAISESVYTLAAAQPFLPDQKGELRQPSELVIPPPALPVEILEMWAATPGRPDDWCHTSAVSNRARRSRTERLLRPDAVTPLSQWLAALVNPPTVEGSASALQIFDSLAPQLQSVPRAQLAGTPLILTAAGRLVPCNPEHVFLPSGGDEDPTGVHYVHPELVAHPGAAAALAGLGIQRVDPLGSFRSRLLKIRTPYRSNEWETFWSAARGVEARDVAHELRKRFPKRDVRLIVHALSCAGTWEPLNALFLSPELFDGARGIEKWVVDTVMHEREIDHLVELGVGHRPEPDIGSLDEPWMETCRSAATRIYYAKLQPGSQRPQQDKLTFSGGAGPLPGPLAPLRHLPETARPALTRAVLELEPDLSPWRMRHKTVRTYPEYQTLNPVAWLLAEHGRFETPFGSLRTADVVAGPELEAWSDFLPVARCGREVAEALGIATRWEELSPDVIERALNIADDFPDLALVGDFYGAMSEFSQPPESVVCLHGDSRAVGPPAAVVVALEGRAVDALLRAGEAVLPVRSSTAANSLVKRWGLRSAAGSLETEVVFTELQPSMTLAEAVPAFAMMLPADQAELGLLRCADLRIDVITSHGRESEPALWHVDDRTVYWVDSGDDRDLLARLNEHFALGLSSHELDELVSQHASDVARQRQREMREISSLEERLSAAIGRHQLVRRLPGLLVDHVEKEGRLDDESAGRMAQAVFGVEVLQRYQEDLAANGFAPPSRWAGTTNARKFVRRLGFPQEFAGFESARRDPTLVVAGKPMLPPLHRFQRQVSEALSRLLAGEGGRRALLALPTGSGKTRVTTQTFIERSLEEPFSGPIVWVAQSDELCEQAVQTWAYVWRAVGPDEDLTISRLWAGNEASAADGRHVVVATIDKLHAISRRDASDYQWLRTPGAVVVDEAHSAIAPTYTAVLEWLGLGRSKKKDVAPLIGLTATPYRGTSEQETKRLVSRFGGVRLDDQAFGRHDPYVVLQEMGVLANVSHRVLEGVEIEMSDAELAMMERTRKLPGDVEMRLGRHLERNDRILQLIQELPSDWPVLLFATSVEHAETMAALLTLEGVSAHSISGQTSRGARHWAIEQFREGRIRVLTNHSVLTEGFDAPAVRAVIVARPTFSPALYQQMVGRGLRGPLNGGAEDCLVVNVADNVARFGERLAFYDFEALWGPIEDDN